MISLFKYCNFLVNKVVGLESVHEHSYYTNLSIFHCLPYFFSKPKDNKYGCFLFNPRTYKAQRAQSLPSIFPPDAECNIGFRKKIADIKQVSNLANDCNIFLYDAVRCAIKRTFQTLRNCCCIYRGECKEKLYLNSHS